MKLTINELTHKIDVFTLNGRLDRVQLIIAPAGYDIIELDRANIQCIQFKDGQNQKEFLLSQQKSATFAEASVKKILVKEITHLSESARTIFSNDLIILSRLGLMTHYMTLAPESGSSATPKKRAARRSLATADLIAFSRLLLSNSLALPADKKVMLSKLGWTDERLTATSALVDDYSTADITQQQAVAAYEKESFHQKESKIVLEKWYRQASHVIKLVLKRLPLEQQIEIKDLLELR
jgi:hypothetical protein